MFVLRPLHHDVRRLNARGIELGLRLCDIRLRSYSSIVQQLLLCISAAHFKMIDCNRGCRLSRTVSRSASLACACSLAAGSAARR
jgi:hypothetical protein